MNLQDQIGALEAGVDQLIQSVVATHAAPPAETASAEPSAPTEPAADANEAAPAEPGMHEPAVAGSTRDGATEPAASADEIAVADADTPTGEAPPADLPTLQIGRPSQNEITMTIGGQTVSLHPLQVGQLVEELANARASMLPEPPPDIPPGWRFASTKNPVMAVQKQSNGDRLLVLRHTGHGWVPFTFSPDMVVQMYMMLTQR